MANYVKTTDFAAKDALPTGNPNKVAQGTQVDTEFNNIATAVATKEDTANKGVANGYPGLDASARLQATNFPAHTGDVTSSAGSLALSIANDSVTDAKLTNMAQATVKGRAAAAGTGDPTDLTAAQLVAIIVAADGAGSGLDADTVDGQNASAFAAVSHGHSAGDLTTGTLDNARVSQGNVTQHQAAITARNISSKAGVSKTLQSGGSASGGADGDIIYIY